MTRHLVAVCVVCLICARHLPCKQHYDNFITDPEYHQALTLNDTLQNRTPSIDHQSNQLPGQDSALYNSVPLVLPNRRRGRTKTIESVTTEHPNRDELETNFLRAKRHTPHLQQTVPEEKPNEFVKRLFREFGDEKTLTMNVIGFENLLRRLGLLNILDEKFNQSTNKTNENRSLANNTVCKCGSILNLNIMFY